MSTQSVSFYIKANRSFSLIRKYVWLLTVLIGIGGQFYPLLGLLVPFIMVALMGTSLFMGKYWCGNFCPHGSFFDNLMHPISRHVKIPEFLRSKVLVGAVFIFFMLNLGNRFFRVFSELGADAFYEKLGLIFSTTYLVVLLVGGVLAITVNARTWCQFCPMGTIQVIFYKLGKALRLNKNTDPKVVVEHPDLCHSCGKCARVCPMQLTPYLNFSEDYQFEDERCIRCYTCVNNCPAGILHLANASKTSHIKENVALDGFSDASYYQAKIISIRELKEDIREIKFQLLEPSRMPFIPGQFVLVEINNSMKMYRAYTISSSQNDFTEISVTVKRLADGYGTNIIFNNFKEGDTVKLKGPMGRDLRVDPSSNELLLISNGIGITPFVSTVQSLFERKDYQFEGKATLIYGARYEEDLVYDDYFSFINETYDHFNYRKILSRPCTRHYQKGYVTDILREIDLLPETKVYICGTPAMAKETMKLLKEKGLPEDNIFYEDFGL